MGSVSGAVRRGGGGSLEEDPKRRILRGGS